MKAYVTDAKSPGSIRAIECAEPALESGQVLVKVTHFSLNRGELSFAASGDPDRRIGWDVAGVVLQSPPGGPEPGARVVGFSRASQGWAERVALPVVDLCPIPAEVPSSHAATLPVAALTALYSLERGKRLLGSRVLITGASGGVGQFAVRLALLMGAEVVAQVRREDQVESIRALGAHKVVVDQEGDKVAACGPYRMIVDGLGNELTAKAIHSLSGDGIALIYGATDRQLLQVQPGFLLGTGSGRVEGFNLYRESEIESVSKGLGRLLSLVVAGRLEVSVEREGTWEEAGQLSQDLIDRKFSGKAVVALG